MHTARGVPLTDAIKFRIGICIIGMLLLRQSAKTPLLVNHSP